LIPKRLNTNLVKGFAVVFILLFCVSCAQAAAVNIPTHNIQPEQADAQNYLPNREVIIAVLDTGISAEHTALSSRIIGAVNFTDSPTEKDICGHGTLMAKTINQVCPDAKLLNVKVADDRGAFNSESAAQGVIWAAQHGANVINMSLFVDKPSLWLQKVIDYAWGSGIVLVASSGEFVGSGTVYPASYENCISVGVNKTWSGMGDVMVPADSTSEAAAYVSGLAGYYYSCGYSNICIREKIKGNIDCD
jgi:thermitase